MLHIRSQTWLYAIVMGLALAVALVLTGQAQTAPPCGPPGNPCTAAGNFMVTDVLNGSGMGYTVYGNQELTGARQPTAGPLSYQDLKLVEAEARRLLEDGLAVREAVSPYQGNVEFQELVQKFNFQARWDPDWDPADGWNASYNGPYGPSTLGYQIDRADQDLRRARDLYAYLAVYAPERHFRADAEYTGGEELCGVMDKEDPDPADPSHSGLVLDPVIDWCNFRARLRQSVREAANIRLIFGQQFMADALGLHFSGIEFAGGETIVRSELAKLRAARHQYELAETGLAEALDRTLGSGCLVSDFYTQSEWGLLSRAVEQQETAQHHIAVRLSYLDIDSPDDVFRVRAAAHEAFRQASIDGYLRLIGLAGLATAQPGLGCAEGERPDGQLAADMALNLLETRRQAHDMAAGRNIFGFDVTFTPARYYKSSVPMGCDETSSGDRGLWDEAWCTAEFAATLQSGEIDASRAYDQSQKELRVEVEKIRQEIDGRIVRASGCRSGGPEAEWAECVLDQVEYLRGCLQEVTNDNILPAGPFDLCMKDSAIKNGEAKQALYDLRAIYMQYGQIQKKVDNITKRVNESNSRNATVTEWLTTSGQAETAARVANATQLMVNGLKPDWKPWSASLYGNLATLAAGAFNISAQAAAGHLSMQAKVEIEDAEHHQEVQNLLLDQSELAIEAYALNQQYYAKQAEFDSMLDGLKKDLVEAKRQRQYLQHSPANDPSFRVVRDSARLQLARWLETAARISYLAARRAEYEYAARLSASNFRISDIYRARTAQDIKSFLLALRRVTDSLPGSGHYQTDPSDFRISIAQDYLLLTDEALAKEGFITPEAAQAERTKRFRQWVVDNTVPNNFERPYDNKPVLKFALTTSLLEGGLFSQEIQQGYDGFWLHKLAGIAEPKATSNGISVNLVSDQAGLSYRTLRLTQAGLVHLRSFSGCTFDYKLIAPAVLLGLEWPKNQRAETSTATFRANVNEAHAYTENGYRTSAFLGRAVSSTDWQVLVFAGAPAAGMRAMDLQQLTDIELIFSTTYASRQPGKPELSDCTRIDW